MTGFHLENSASDRLEHGSVHAIAGPAAY